MSRPPKRETWTAVFPEMQLNQVTVPAIDVDASIKFYCGLGLRLIVKALPRYARFECPDGGATFSIHQVESLEPQSQVVVYFECKELDATVQRLQAIGYVFDQAPQNEVWLWREARLRDPANNTICLYWAGENRRFPPWRIVP